RRAGRKEIALEVHRVVADVLVVEDTAPFDGECHAGDLRKASRKDFRQGTLQIVVVEYVRGQVERGASAAQRDGHAVVWDRDSPEQTIRRDVRVVIMSLIRSNWTVVDVKSDESERRIVVFSIDRDVLADHESHVGLKCR